MADKSTVGVRLEADGEAEFKRSLKEIAQTGKTLSAEMKALESSFTDETSAQEKAEQRAELLNRQIQNQQNYVDQLSQKLDEARNSTDYNATATAKLEEQLYKAQAALNGMTSDLSATQAELAATGSEAENAGSWTEKLKEAAEQAGPAIKNGLETMATVAATSLAALAAAAAAAAAAIANGISDVAEYGDNIDKMSQKLGISAEAYQEWDAVMQHSGTSMETLKTSMKTLATAAETGNEAFAKIGLTQEEIAGMNQEQLFEATLRGLQGVEDETQRMYLAGQLLGRGATELGPLLNTSAAEVDAMRQRVHELGGVMSDEAVKASAAYQDTLQDMNTALQGMQRNLLAEFLPGITSVMGGLTEIFTGNGEGGIQMISEGIEQVTTQITEMLPGFLELGTQILQALVTSLTNNLPQILESGAAMIGQLVAGLAKAVPQLIAMAPQLIKSLISGFVSAWPQIREAGSQLLTQLGDTIKGGISAAWSWGSDLIANFANGIIAKAQEVWDAVKGVATSIWELLHFSEPEKGPLANFSTYAPDMMRTFAQGIRANEHLVADAVAGAFDLAPVINAQSSAGRSYNYGGVNVVIYGSQGQSADELYEVFSCRLQQDVARQEVFA